MGQYFYTNPWADAAAVGNSVAASIAHLAVQIPQIRLQQQRLAQEQALINARAQSELAQAQAYTAHAGLYNRQTAEIGQDQVASKEAGFALGDFAKSYMAGAPDIQQKAQIAVEKFAPYARAKPQEGLAALQKVLTIVGSQGKDPATALAFLTENAGALRPMSVPLGNRLLDLQGKELSAGTPRPVTLPAESRLVSPTGQELAPVLGFSQTPGEVFNFNPEAVKPTQVDIPAMPTFGPGFPAQQVQAKVTPGPIVSPIQQRQASQASPYGLLSSLIERGGLTEGTTNAPGTTERQRIRALTTELLGRAGLGQEQQGQVVVPKVGEVRKGYRYIGGDPAKPESWQKVQ